MKIFKKIVSILLVIVILIVGISLFLPNDTHVERSIIINAPIEKVYGEVNTFSNLLDWSPWAQIDPENTKWVFSGPENGVGAKYTWDSENPEVLSGSQEIIESTPFTNVKTKMVFADMEDDQFAEFILKKEGEATYVTWTYDGQMTGIINKYVGAFFMDMILGSTYEKGVANLKEYIEALPETAPKPEVIEDFSENEVESM